MIGVSAYVIDFIAGATGLSRRQQGFESPWGRHYACQYDPPSEAAVTYFGASNISRRFQRNKDIPLVIGEVRCSRLASIQTHSVVA